MQNEHRIPIIYARIIGHRASNGLDQMKLVLQGTGIDQGDDAQQASGMSLQQYRQLLYNAQQVSNDEYIAMNAATDLVATVHGPLGVASAASPTLGAAIDVIVHFGRLRNPFSRITIKRNGDYQYLCINIDPELKDQAEPALDFMFSAIASSLISMLSLPLQSVEIHRKKPTPENPHAYNKLLPCPVLFAQNDNALVLHKNDLKIELLSANEELYNTALNQCRAIYIPDSKSGDLVERMYAQFWRMSGQICGIEKIANELNVSTRTLQRKFKAQGVSFQQLRDQWLATQASSFLLEENLTIEVSATLLGYRDEANFRRAFKRWYGLTPGMYRRSKKS